MSDNRTTQMGHNVPALTKNKVVMMRRLKAANPRITWPMLGYIFGCSQSAAERACNGVTWKHV